MNNNNPHELILDLTIISTKALKHMVGSFEYEITQCYKKLAKITDVEEIKQINARLESLTKNQEIVVEEIDSR